MNQALDRGTLELIQQTAVSASNAKDKVAFLQPPGWDDMILVVKPDGTYEDVGIPAPRRQHTLAEVAQVGPYCAYMAEVLGMDTLETAAAPGVDDAGAGVKVKVDGRQMPVVWYNQRAVVVVCNDSERRDTATCLLAYTDHFARLIELVNSPEELRQKEFIRLLKYDLADCVPESLLKAARKVVFSTGEEGFGDIGRGKTSLGNSVRAAINTENDAEFPDEVVVKCRVFTDLSLQYRANVKCDLDVDAHTQTFILRPYPGEIERVTDEALESLGDLLASEIGDTARLFRGTP